MSNGLLKEQFQYFKDNIAHLAKQYKGQYVVITDKKVIFSSTEEMEAYNYATENLPKETFIIQKCDPEIDNYSAMFHSRVIFV